MGEDSDSYSSGIDSEKPLFDHPEFSLSEKYDIRLWEDVNAILWEDRKVYKAEHMSRAETAAILDIVDNLYEESQLAEYTNRPFNHNEFPPSNTADGARITTEYQLKELDPTEELPEEWKYEIDGVLRHMPKIVEQFPDPAALKVVGGKISKPEHLYGRITDKRLHRATK